MTVLNLKVIHRLLLRGALDSYGKEGQSLSNLNKMMKVLDKLIFTEDEVKQLKIETKDGAVTWKNTKNGKPDGEPLDVDKAFEFSVNDVEILVAMFKHMNEKKEFNFQNAALSTVAEQLGLEL